VLLALFPSLMFVSKARVYPSVAGLSTPSLISKSNVCEQDQSVPKERVMMFLTVFPSLMFVRKASV
jgi:hypothetical protein